MIQTECFDIDPTSITTVIRRPKMPTCLPINDGNLQLKTLITVCGSRRSEKSDYFKLAFLTSENSNKNELEKNLPVSVALEFHAVYGPPVDICMNSFLDGKWGEKEQIDETTNDGLILSTNVPFCLTFLVKETGFQIAIDGKHLYHFKHRCPIQLINRLCISGCFDVDFVEFRKDLNYLNKGEIIIDENYFKPFYVAHYFDEKTVTHPTVPFLEYKPRLSYRNCNSYISGRLPNPFGTDLIINLVNTEGNQRNSSNIENIPVQIRFKANGQGIAGNSMINGVWGEEISSEEKVNELVPGKDFDINLITKQEMVEVTINESKVFEFKYRNDRKTIDGIQILGCVELHSVRVASDRPLDEEFFEKNNLDRELKVREEEKKLLLQLME